MTAAPTQLRPLGIGEVLDVALKIVWRNAGTLIRVVVFVVLPVQIVSALLAASVSPESLNSGSSFTFQSQPSSTLSSSDVKAVIGYGIAILLLTAYFTYFEGGPTGQTLGKRALGIRVIDFGGSGSIGYGRAFIRWIGRFVSAVVFLLGYLWMLWDAERQTWHDKFANSVVVPVSDYPV